jgi:hypothetical protein
MSYVTGATAKGSVGGAGLGVALIEPTTYTSVFDRVYDMGLFTISGNDASRIAGGIVAVIIAANIIYGWYKDYRQLQRYNL